MCAMGFQMYVCSKRWKRPDVEMPMRLLGGQNMLLLLWVWEWEEPWGNLTLKSRV